MQETSRRPGYSTEEASRRLHVKPQTLRAALCRDGHYLGVAPRKMANRMLDWPAEKIDALMTGGR
ncbi:MAG: hypothetical protein KDG55_08740 [Rhodocyclaceae bacterium]|nr:hypothetical protein [Rhodocyclaceae bacterium]